MAAVVVAVAPEAVGDAELGALAVEVVAGWPGLDLRPDGLEPLCPDCLVRDEKPVKIKLYFEDVHRCAMNLDIT